MNILLPARPRWRSALTFEADWTRVLFLHFEIAPERLVPHVPLPLDLREGKAYVSLVNFGFDRLRFAGTRTLGRILCRPLSDHPFLNVRTYVRGIAGPGILFLAEWINNPLSLRAGPWTHGLPYRLGRFTSHFDGQGGTSHVGVTDRAGHGVFRVTYPSVNTAMRQPADAGTLAHFLLERYRAYTTRKGTTRTFAVIHEPWPVSPVDWIRYDLEMLLDAFPWFCHAAFVGAHTSPGLSNVTMNAPERLDRLPSVVPATLSTVGRIRA